MNKLYDFFMCGFPYEADLLYLKLLEEHEHVERFYIVETDRTHQDNPKPYHGGEILKEPRFQRFADKIQYDTVSSAELGFIGVKTMADAQHNEHAQRDWLYLQHRDEIADEDIVWVSDVDEILGGEDIPKILEAFGSHEQLRALHIPLVRSTYDYAYIDEQRGYWPTIAARKAVVNEFYHASLSAVRATFYHQVCVLSMIQAALPTRYRDAILKQFMPEVLGKALWQSPLCWSLRQIPNQNLATLLVDCRIAAYYGWHFSYCFKNPIDIFRKPRTIFTSQVGKPENIARDLAMARLRLHGHGPIVPLKPFLVQWPLNARLFPKALVENPEYYLTRAEEKMAGLTPEQIKLGLEGE